MSEEQQNMDVAIQLVTGEAGGEVRTLSDYNELASVPLPESDEELTHLMKGVMCNMDRGVILITWFQGRCASKMCMDDVENQGVRIDQVIGNLAGELRVSKRTLYDARKLYREFPDIEYLNRLSVAGLSWETFRSVILPLDAEKRVELLNYITEYITNEEQAPPVQDIRNKAAELNDDRSPESAFQSSGDPEEEEQLNKLLKFRKETSSVEKTADKLEKSSNSLMELMELLYGMDLSVKMQQGLAETETVLREQLVRLIRTVSEMNVDAILMADQDRGQLAETLTEIVSQFGRAGIVPVVEKDDDGSQYIVYTSSKKS